METEHPARLIIRRWPDRRTLAVDLGTDIWAVHRYWQRKRLWPGARDARALAAARRRGIALTADELVAARAIEPTEEADE